MQEILANKQARGAFGQMRMETIVQDGLPKGAYTFQADALERQAAGLPAAYAEHDAPAW